MPGSTLTGHTDAVEHEIYTGHSIPIRCAPSRMSPRKINKEEECVADMLAGGQIDPSESPWFGTGRPGDEKRWWYPVMCEHCDSQGRQPIAPD